MIIVDRPKDLTDAVACLNYRKSLAVQMEPEVRAIAEVTVTMHGLTTEEFVVFVLDLEDQLAGQIASALYRHLGREVPPQTSSKSKIVAATIPRSIAGRIVEQIDPRTRENLEQPLITEGAIRIIVFAAAGAGTVQLQPADPFGRVVAGGKA